jgi:hypothetical protein
MAFEGGGLATRVCVPSEQNGKQQGSRLWSMTKRCGLKRGERFLIKIEGGCNSISEPSTYTTDDSPDNDANIAGTKKRDVATVPMAISGSDVTLWDPAGGRSFTFVAVDLDYLEMGDYDLEVTFNGTAERIAVIDDGGAEYAL